MVAWRKIISYIFIPVLAILLMSHNTFATDVVPSGANASGWNGNPKISCYTLAPSGTSWSAFNNYCAVSIYPAGNIGVRAVSFRDKNGAAIWAYTGDYLQIQLTLTASGSEVQPQIYYLPDDNANLQMISMKVDGSFTASEGKELIITYYAKYLGANNPTELMMGSTTGREFLSYFPNNYILGGMSISAWHVEASNNDDVVAAIEEQTQKEDQAVDNIENQDTSDIDTGDTSSALSIIGNIQNITGIIQDAPLKENCIINANFGNLNLGGLNLCSGRENMATVADFGNAVFAFTTTLAGSIYLVRKTLKLIDWARGD